MKKEGGEKKPKTIWMDRIDNDKKIAARIKGVVGRQIPRKCRTKMVDLLVGRPK